MQLSKNGCSFMLLLIFAKSFWNIGKYSENKVEENTGDEQFVPMYFYPGRGVYQFTSK